MVGGREREKLSNLTFEIVTFVGHLLVKFIIKLFIIYKVLSDHRL